MKRLLLAGAGHAHLGVLRALAATPLPDTEVVLVTPHARQVHSVMLPGWVAGHYTLDQCMVALPALAQRARVRLVLGHVTRVNLDSRHLGVQAAPGTAPVPPSQFDLLSIDTDPQAGADAIPGSAEFGIPLQPLESFVAAWMRLHVLLATTQLRGGASSTISVLGGGAEAVEFAMAIAWRARTARIPLRVQLVAGQGGVLPAARAALRRRVLALLLARRVRVLDDEAIRIGRGAVKLARGGEVPSDATLVMTGSAAPDWPRAGGLHVDSDGRIGTDALLRSVSHPFVFAAGLCASILDHPRPRSAFFAMRAGAPLADNLRRALAGHPLRAHAPPRRALEVLTAGPHHAIASWEGLRVEGKWVWRWKDRQDRSYVARHGNPASC